MQSVINSYKALKSGSRRLAYSELFAIAWHMVYDGPIWITTHPNGKGPKADGSGNKKGRHVLIESTNGKILKGPFKGHKITEIGKKPSSNPLASTTTPQVPSAPGRRNTSKTKQLQTVNPNVTTPVTQQPDWVPMEARFKGNVQHPAVQRVWQPLATNPLPSDFDSSEEAVNWYGRAFPFLETAGIKHLNPRHAHGIAKGASAMLWLFPFLASKNIGLTGITNEAQRQEELSRYETMLSKQIQKIKSDTRTKRAILELAKQKVHEAFSLVSESSWSVDWFSRSFEVKYTNLDKILPKTKAAYDNLTQEQQSALRHTLEAGYANAVIHAYAESVCCDLGVIKPILNKELPEAKEYSWVAYFEPQDRSFWTCKAFFGAEAKTDFDQMVYAGAGFHPAAGHEWTNSALIAIHELTHSLDLALGNGRSYHLDSDKEIVGLYTLFKKEEETKAIKRTNYTKPYALENVHEFFAEFITEALTSSNPSFYAKMVLHRALRLQGDRLL